MMTKTEGNMRFEKTLIISKLEAAIINRYLTEEPRSESECLGEDSTITKTVKFDNGIQMDIKCCGVQFIEGESNLAWTEAVLFDKNGTQLCFTEPADEFLGEWICEDDGDEYVVNVVTTKQIVVTDIKWDAPKSANLPKRVVIDITAENEYLLEDINEYAENLSDYLSDTYEYCHAGFSVTYN